MKDKNKQLEEDTCYQEGGNDNETQEDETEYAETK